MRQGLKYGFIFTWMLPLGCSFAAEPLSEKETLSTLQALNAITSRVDETPAILLLSPSQLDIALPPPEKEISKPAKRPSAKKTDSQINELKALQAQINQLNGALSLKEQELTQLRQSIQQDTDARAEVAQLKQTLQENLQATERMQQELAVATSAKTENSKEGERLQQALEKSQQQSSLLQKQLDAMALSHNDNNKENKALREELNESQKQNESLQKELVSLKEKTGEQLLENSVLHQQLAVATMQKPVIEPKTTREIRDYAIGSSLAEDMLALLKERATQGVEVDTRLALAGVQDTFSGKLKLQQEQISHALDEAEEALNTNKEQLKKDTETAGLRYIEQFEKQKQVKKEPSGYLYRIDSTGKGKIGDNNIVSVVVKESLIDGKVIKDMEAAGTSITQPLSSYPPMFRSAISKLQNHGSMTMVVPPALAYGDKGLPPEIPPGSTMIYNLKVVDVVAPADVAAAAK